MPIVISSAACQTGISSDNTTKQGSCAGAWLNRIGAAPEIENARAAQHMAQTEFS